MKRILIISNGNGYVGALATAWISHFSKTSTSLFETHFNQASQLTDAEDLLKEQGLKIPDSFKIDITNAGDKEFDYVISVSNEANELGQTLAGKGLHFHYHFDEPCMQETENQPDLNEISLLMKLYFERFCKIYLNEFC